MNPCKRLGEHKDKAYDASWRKQVFYLDAPIIEFRFHGKDTYTTYGSVDPNCPVFMSDQ